MDDGQHQVGIDATGIRQADDGMPGSRHHHALGGRCLCDPDGCVRQAEVECGGGDGLKVLGGTHHRCHVLEEGLGQFPFPHFRQPANHRELSVIASHGRWRQRDLHSLAHGGKLSVEGLRVLRRQSEPLAGQFRVAAGFCGPGAPVGPARQTDRQTDLV